MPFSKPRRTHTELLARTPFIEVSGHRVAYDDGSENQVLTFTCPDWVSIVPITPEGDLVLVRQYRHGVDDFTIEVPGGLVDPGESPAAAATRELREETGYEGGELTPLGWCHPNPPIEGNRHHMFIARGVVPTAVPKVDPVETCEVMVWPLPQVRRAMRDGTISHALVLLSLSRALELLSASDRDAADGHERAKPTGECAGAEAVVAAGLRGAIPGKGAVWPQPGDEPHGVLDEVVQLLESMRALQSRKVLELARRLRPNLTPEDIRNPHDFPELEDSDWHFADGQLTGIESVLVALRAHRFASRPNAPPPAAEASEPREAGER